MKQTHGIAVIAGALVVAAAIPFFPREDSIPPTPYGATPPAPAPASASHPLAPGAAWSPDPMAASRPHAGLPPHVVARQKKMQALMTRSPPQYDTMTLGQLRELAKHGDADAMMQLAEQYANEDARLRADPDYPVAENTRELTRGYLADALVSGRIRAAALLSKQLFDENKLGEAFAWRRVSEKLGDSVNPLWSDTNQFASLSESEKAIAEARATDLVNTLYQNKLREYTQQHPPSR